MRSFLRRYLSSAGVPPMAWISAMTYFPDGLRSASSGIRSLTDWKSSMVSLTPTECAMAMRWRTALVEPPVMLTTTMAFSKADRVRMSRGLISFSRRVRIALPASRHSCCLAAEIAGLEEEPGRVMPMDSMAVAIVLAVYMPPHAPGPGQAWRIMSKRVASSISLVRYWP